MKFSVPEMSCGHCTAAIEQAVKAADPTADITCDLPGRSVEVTSQLSAEAIAKTLSDAGYEATLTA
ncbi:MAG: heavy-metal-associated domain-containing protein [Pseudodonghicola sp.]